MSEELDALDPQLDTVTLESGLKLRVERLKTRQFFKFLRILTKGALPTVSGTNLLNLDPEADPSEFATRLISLVLLAIPEAEDEAVDFIKSMVVPVGLVDRPKNKLDAERNAERWLMIDDELENPELDDVVTIFERVILNEAGNMQALGKRLAGLFKLAQKTGQLKSQSPTSKAPNSSAGSRERSTSSVLSTGGQTSNSVTSVSAASDSVWLQFGNDGTTETGPTSNG